MKTSFSSHSELCHVWANLNQPDCVSGRSLRSSNMHAEGSTLFTWGTALAKHVFARSGSRLVLFNGTRYSNSSSKHQCHASRAIHGDSVTLDNLSRGASVLDLDGKQVFANLCAQATDLIRKASRARTNKGHYLTSAQRKANEANTARTFFKLRCKAFAPDIHAEMEAWRAQEDARLLAEKQAKALREKLLAQFRPRALALWRASDTQEMNGSLLAEIRAAGLANFTRSDLLTSEQRAAGFSCVLRLSSDRSRVETSQGAQVLVRTVRFLWAFCSTAKATQTAVASEVLARFPRLDNYTCNEIDSAGNVRAGCHFIPFAEVETIARELGLPPFNGEPAEAPEIPEIPVSEEVTA